MRKIHVEDIYQTALQQLKLGAKQNRLFRKTEVQWHPLLPQDFAILLRELYLPEERKTISTNAINEVYDRLLQDPDIQLKFVDDENENLIKLNDGIFDLASGRIDSQKKGEFFNSAKFRYIPKDKRNMPTFDKFVSSVFPADREIKKKLLLEVLGYCISNCQTAKAAFFLIGESNSGKSTILNLLQSILPDYCLTFIPLYRLENRFNLARLADSRLNINTEISEKSFSSADIFKMLTSHERVTAEHKGCKPFEFQIRCKSINAGNLLPDFNNVTGMNAILSRLIILLFPVEIPKSQQDPNLFNNLLLERDSIFSNALDALVKVKSRNFQFSEPEDSRKLKEGIKASSSSIADFVKECCIYEPDARVYLFELYENYVDFCNRNMIAKVFSKHQFSQYFSCLPGIERRKIRIRNQSPLSGLLGIRLLNFGEYSMQDSQV